jgi:DNA-binding PadR family transcriptional regulator
MASVLEAFLEDAGRQRYGYELMRATGFASGKLYPVLARLQAAGWLEAQMEDVDPYAAGRPARRWYRFADGAAAFARQELANYHRQPLARQQMPPRWRPESG